MPIIINEFEMMTEPQPAASGSEQSGQHQVPLPLPLQPQDVERIQCRYEQRMARIRAD